MPFFAKYLIMKLYDVILESNIDLDPDWSIKFRGILGKILEDSQKFLGKHVQMTSYLFKFQKKWQYIDL